MIITIDDFKQYFYKDFPYLPIWEETKTYNSGQEVFYKETELFYIAKNNNVVTLPTDTNDWELVEDSILNYISDKDILRAIDEMLSMLPASRFDEFTLRIAQLYLTAHCLVNDVRNANSGIASTFVFPLQSKSVGSVSQSYSIPSRFLTKEIFSFYITTGYGLKYLALLIPRMKGNISIAKGWTLP